MDKSIMTPLEVASYLGIGKTKVYELLRADGFPVLTLGKLKRVVKSELDAYLKSKSYNGGL